MAASSRPATAGDGGLQTAAVDQLGNFDIQVFKIDYANVGAAAAAGATLEFQIPEKLRGQQPVLVKGSDAARESISFNFDRLIVRLPSMVPNTGGSLVLGWYGCITCTLAAAGTVPDAASVD